jgi:hypothetical protein
VFSALAVFLLVFMGQDVRREIDALATANSDSTQWSLAQADVELLALKWAIWAAQAEDGEMLARCERASTSSTAACGRFRRVPLFAGLREDPEVIAALDRINAYLAESVPIIDGSDADLAAALPRLGARTRTSARMCAS